MMKRRRLLTACLLMMAALTACPQALPPAPESSPTAKPGTRWWWLGSAVDHDGLEWSLGEYARVGIGAVEITPLYGVKGNESHELQFLSPQWMKALRDVEQIAAQKGIQVDMNCGTGWPFGGPEVTLDEAACKVVVVDTVVSVKVAKDLVLQAPESERSHARLIVQNDYPVPRPDYRRVIALYESRTLQQVKRAAPGGEGYVIDHFDSTAVAHYLDHFERAFAETSTPYPETFFNDSYEVYDADWTPGLLDEFARRHGYRLEKHLPAFADGREKILSDYRETLAALLLKNFTRQWVEWCHRHGVKVRNQAHGSPANLIDVYGAVDIPEIESYGLTDFGIKGLRTDKGNTRKNDSDLSMLKYASSASHILGKPITTSESFTWLTEHFRTSLSQMKPDMDLMFCAGVNRLFFHGSCYSPKDEPWPGWKFYASIDMSPTNSIWRDAPLMMKYIERCQTYLQWGQPDNDFLVFLPVRNMWQRNREKRLMQFDIHEMERRAPDFRRLIASIDTLGYDCDYISEQYLLNTTVTADRQLRTEAGTTYRGLIVPDNSIMPDSVRAFIYRLRDQGVHVITGAQSYDLIEAAKPEPMKKQLGLHMIRRSNEGGHHYFIANLTPNDVEQSVELAVDFEDALWYDPMTGKSYAVEFDNGKVKIALRSGESMILQTFKHEQQLRLKKKPYVSQAKPVQRMVLYRGWKLSFENSEPAIKKTYSLDTLRTWEKLDSKTRTLMGTGVYQCSFDLKKKMLNGSRTWQIELGDVRECAHVNINGHDIGCAWAVPFVLTFDASILKLKKNIIRVSVNNLPANRIAEMDRKGIEWRKMKDLNVVDINYQHTNYANWEPMPSGLNSRVRLVRVE